MQMFKSWLIAVVEIVGRWCRYSHGDDHDRLTTSIQEVQICRVTDVCNPDWIPRGDSISSPLAALAAADQVRRRVEGLPRAYIQ